ncbi:MAG: hypothetical protein AAGI30_04830 [Planctomycetota bacterium]
MREGSHATSTKPPREIPCVVLTPRGNGVDPVAPVDLLRDLRQRDVKTQVEVDVHEAFAELIVHGRELSPSERCILIVVEPAQQPLAAPLLRTLHEHMPRVVIWQYRSKPTVTLSPFTESSLAEPKLRLALEEQGMEAGEPSSPPTSESSQELEPLLSEEELDMLLHPPPISAHVDDPPPRHGANP